MEKFNWEKESEKQWNGMANSWNSRSEGMWKTGSRKDIVPFIKKYVPLGAHICDLGCGDGTGSAKLAEAGYLVTGMDMSDEMLEIAKRNALTSELSFKKANLSACGSQDDSFEAIMAINSIEWTSSPYESLKEMARILKPGGYACIGILGPTAGPRKSSYRRLYDEKVIGHTIMPWELDRLAQENGWTKVGEYGVYKKEANQVEVECLPTELQQALSFMWVFMFQLKALGSE